MKIWRTAKLASGEWELRRLGKVVGTFPTEAAAQAKQATLREAYSDLSLEGRAQMVRDAYCEQMQPSGVSPSEGYDSPWVLEVQDAAIIVCKDGDYFSIPYTVGGPDADGDDDAVTFGAATPVKLTYVAEAVRVKRGGALAADAPMRLVEAEGVPRGAQWLVRVIAPGFSKNRSQALGLPRYYPEAVLKEAVPQFAGVRIFEHEAAPHVAVWERRSQDCVGWLANPRWDHGIVADFQCIGSDLRRRLLEAHDLGRPQGVVGFSINGDGREQAGMAEGQRAAVIQSIGAVDSVDVVSDPAAGGSFVRLVASVDPTAGGGRMDLKALLAKIRGIRPELVATEPEGGWTEATLTAKLEEALKPPAGASGPSPEVVQLRETVTVQAAQLAGIQATLLESTRRAAVASALDGSKLAKMPAARLAVERRVPLHEADAAKFTAALAESIAEQVAAADEAGKVVGFGPALVTTEASDRHRVAMDGMIAGRDLTLADGTVVPKFRTLRESYLVMKGGRLLDYNVQDVLREAVMFQPATRDFGHKNPLRESVDTSSWGQVLGDSITRRMVAEYGMPELNSWRNIVSELATITDFRTQRRTRFGGYGDLATVAQGSPYPDLTSPTDEEATYAISKKGGVDDLTIETIANDDMQAVRRIPISMGRAAARTLYKAVWTLISGNGLVYDGSALFDTSTPHGNATASAVSDSTVKAAIIAMRNMSPYGVSDEVLGAVNKPRWFAIPNDIEDIVFRILNSDRYVGATNEAGTTPNLVKGAYGGLQYIVVDTWTDAADAALIADPNQIPTIEVGFWNGQEIPEMFVQDQPMNGSMFTADKVTYKVRHVWGVTVLEYRSFYGFSR